MTTEPMQIPLVDPKCPACKQPLKGVNVAGMKLPVPAPDGKSIASFITFMVPCCPNPKCGVALAVQFTGQEDAPPPGAAAGLWTPPGSH